MGRGTLPDALGTAGDGSLTRVAASPIDGKGLFAARPIAKDTLIGRLEGVATRHNGRHVLWYLNDDGEEVGLRCTNKMRYVNHSGAPNAEFRGPEVWSLRSIEPGEEVTCDYGPSWPRAAPEEAKPALPGEARAGTRKRKSQAELRTEKCRRCKARCCKNVSLHLSAPSTRADYDVFRWYLHHRDVQLFLNHAGDWMIEFVTPCEQLNPDGLCEIYESRPKICRSYPSRRQYCEFERDPYLRLFRTAAELDAYLAEQGKEQGGG